MAENLDHIAVIGGGWAACAAAVTLAQAGRRVSLFESARILGGRARRVESDGHALDNGQHILLGAYCATLKIMKAVGIDADRMLLRLPLQL
ncbi:MAG TPA: NAD(P)-binding protein, partial [Herbaspirillum sp.]|nr:NAD(P)-binding protein [Herbaspirillum sp.]